jgi:DNA-directed RNA polymerase specialized sigma24 family protein
MTGQARTKALVEALARLDGRDNAAAAYHSLVRAAEQALARQGSRRVALHPECAHEIVVRMWRRHALGAFRPENDAQVVAYLETAVCNAITDAWRRQTRERTVPLLDADERATEEPPVDAAYASPDPACAPRAFLRLAGEAATSELCGRDREAVMAAFDDAMRIYLDGCSVASLVDERAGADADGATRIRMRNRIYKSVQRVRERILEGIDRLESSGRCDGERAEAWRRFVCDGLRNRRPAP